LDDKKIDMKVLLIPASQSDYLQDSIYLGFKDLFGKDVESTQECSYLYKGSNFDKNRFWGYGFTYTNILDSELQNVTRESTLEKIKDNYYDIIVYTNVSRNSWMIDEVTKYTDKNKLFLVNVEDEHWRFEHLSNDICYFKRELHKITQKNIKPIFYGIHKSKLFEGSVEKTQDLSISIPSLDYCTNISSSKIIFDNEKEYYDDYRISKFGLTKKKGGWDSMRHYEILANKCVPIFENIDDCPETCLINLPKKKLSKIEKSYKKFTDEDYNEIQSELYNFTKENLTTDCLAKYILNFV
jgi:hypothetical protein